MSKPQPLARRFPCVAPPPPLRFFCCTNLLPRARVRLGFLCHALCPDSAVPTFLFWSSYRRVKMPFYWNRSSEGRRGVSARRPSAWTTNVRCARSLSAFRAADRPTNCCARGGGEGLRGEGRVRERGSRGSCHGIHAPWGGGGLENGPKSRFPRKSQSGSTPARQIDVRLFLCRVRGGQRNQGNQPNDPPSTPFCPPPPPQVPSIKLVLMSGLGAAPVHQVTLVTTAGGTDTFAENTSWVRCTCASSPH